MMSKRKIFIGFSLLAILLTACQSGGHSSIDEDSHSSRTSNSERDSSSESNSEESSSQSSESSSDETKYFTITWKNYDGTVLEVDKNVKEGETPSYDGEIPTKPDDETYTYTWSGWDPLVKAVDSNQTYVATYSFEKVKVEYVIDFDLNGGASASYDGPVTVETFSKDVFFFDCTKEGLNFRGWSYKGSKIFDEKGNLLLRPEMSKKMTFVAMYSNTAKLTIISNLNGAGEITGEGEYPYNTYVDVSANAKQGYELVGWYYEGTLLSQTSDYKYMMWSEDVTLEARFKLASFLMNIHSNNEDYGLVLLKSSLNNDYLSEYQEYRDYTSKVTIAAFSKTDVRFLGWYDSENKLVATEAVYSFSMPNEDYALEAKWNYFKVSYNLNGGTNSTANPSSYTKESKKIKLNDPVKTCYTFLGWQYKGKYVSEIDPNWIDNIELNAIWETTNYSINYVLSGGENAINNPSTYTIETETIKLEEPSRTGYTFDGWYGDSDFRKKVSEIDKGSYGDIYLYAKWTPVVYSIAYELNGGINAVNNPSTYTIESEYVLSAPTKTGYTFLGWFDESGKQITSINAGTIGELRLGARWNEGNKYSITLDPNGGTSDETLINVQYDQEYSLPSPVRKGYGFDGWYDGTSKVSNSGIWKYTSSKTFVARWSTIEYSISYELNGGANSSSNPSSYTVEDNIALKDPTKMGYAFLGWYKENTKITNIHPGNTGNMAIEARWNANLNKLSVTSEDDSKGTVSIALGNGYTDESITVTATPVDDYAFKGWYHGSIKVSDEATYTFKMPASDYSLVAYFYTKAEEQEEEWEKNHGVTPVLSSDKKTITYGLYPQTVVSDAALAKELNSLTTTESNGWYLYNKEYYAKLSAQPHNFDGIYDRFNNGQPIVRSKTYWFKCEPITWNVLSKDDNGYFAVSSLVLAYYYYEGAMSNNYHDSEIRAWLNNTFYNSAFALGNKYIQTTTVDNSASTTDSSSNIYDCENTEDKVFLPSYKDYINGEYGFGLTTNSSNTRECKTTDYARADGVYSSIESKYSHNGVYWTRSPYSDNEVWFVSIDGKLDHMDLNSRRPYSVLSGVRPCLYIVVT